MEAVITILNILFIALICWWHWRRQVLPLRKFYWHGVAAKLSAGILLGVVYAASYETSDTFFMFEGAEKLSRLARTDFEAYLNYLWSGGTGGYFMGADRTIFFEKIASMFALLTQDNYWISSLYFSLISFFAAWYLVKIIWNHFPESGLPAVIAFLFFPSCVFWTSGIIKESLAMAGLYFLAGLFLQIWWRQRISIVAVVMGALSIWIAWNLKYYYIGLFIPVLLAAWATRKITEWKKFDNFSVEVIFFLGMLFIPVLIAGFIHPNLSIALILGVLIANNQIFNETSATENVIHFYALEETWLSVIANSPWALISGLFRPFVWEVSGILKFLISLENLLVLVLVIISLRSVSEIKRSPVRLLIMAVLIYACVLCIFLAISTPNFGTLVRYRIGFIPFLILILLNRPFIVRTLAKLFNVNIASLPR